MSVFEAGRVVERLEHDPEGSAPSPITAPTFVRCVPAGRPPP